MSTTADRQSARPTSSPAGQPLAPNELPWYRTTLAQALTGSLLMWAALPPVELGWLAWIAPVPWLLLARRETLIGRRPYRAIWLAGFVFWFAALHWLRLPHPATSIGWVALSFYLAFYVPLFVGLTRVAVHRLRMSLIVAAPVVWTGLELAKAHLMSGFTMGSLEHTQYHWPIAIQISDLAGGYGVCFAIVLVAACLARMLPMDGRRWAIWPLAPLAATMAAVLLYGHYRLGEAPPGSAGPTARIALIQGSVDTEMKTDPGQSQLIYVEYIQLSEKALAAAARMEPKRDVDLIVWPETMFRAPLISIDEPAPQGSATSQQSDSQSEEPQSISLSDLRKDRTAAERLIVDTARGLGAPLLLGIDRWHRHAGGAMDHFNSALFVTADGRQLGRYDKMHPVVFGEYVPLADRFPLLSRLTPIHSGLTVGAGPISEKIAGLRFSPNICYETAVPHLIRRQVAELADRGEEPDVLVNLTNDGWFWGSSELDMHLACGVFRAVECRKPLLIAANTGFSAFIDADGRIVRQGPRREKAEKEPIVVDVQADGRQSFYLRHGDWPAGACLAACFGLAAVGVWDRRRSKAPAA